MKNTKRLLSIVLAVLMCVSMLTGIILPASAADPATDAYAKINATDNGDGTFTPAANVYFIDNAIDNGTEPALGEDITYKYGDDAGTWGNGVTYKLKYDQNIFGSWADAKAKMIALSAAWVDGTESNGEAVFVFAPGGYGSSTGQTTLTAKAEDPTQEQLFSVVLLGPQAGKSPVNPDLTTEEKMEAIQNNRGAAGTEFWFNSTIWLPDHAKTYWDGFGIKDAGEIFGGEDYIACEMTNIYYTTTNGKAPSGGQVLAFNNTNIIFRMSESYLNYEHQFTTTSEPTQPLYGNDFGFDRCVFFKGTLATTHDYNQTHHMRWFPNAKASASANFYGEKAEKPHFYFTNGGAADWAASHFIRFSIADSKYSGYPTRAITADVNGNYFYDMNQGAYAGDIIDFNKPTTAAQKDCITFNMKGNLFSFSDEWETIKTSSKVGAVINAVSTNNDTAKNLKDFHYNIEGNIIKMDPISNHMFTTMGVPNVDISANLFIDNKNNVVPFRTNVGGYQASISWGFNANSDVYSGAAMKGGLREQFVVREIEGGAVLHSGVMLYARGSKNNVSRIHATATLLLERKDDGTPIEYNAADLFKYENPNIKFQGVFAEEACTTPVSTVNMDNVDGKFAKATLTETATALGMELTTTTTVIYKLFTPTHYFIVDPDGKYTEGYKFNGVTYTPDGTNADGITTPAAKTRGDGKTGFYQYVDNSHSDVSSTQADYCAYANQKNTVGDYPGNDDYNNFDSMAQLQFILLTPGTHVFGSAGTSSQGMGKNVSFIGPQWNTSPYGESNKTGTLAGGRSFDSATEAIVKGQFAPDGGGTRMFAFLGLTFESSVAGIKSNNKGSAYGSQYHELVIKNCIFGGTTKQSLDFGGDKTNCVMNRRILIKDTVFDATGVTRAGADSLVNARSVQFTMENVAVLNDNKSPVTGHRLVYLGTPNGDHVPMNYYRTYADFKNVIMYNSNCDLMILSLRDNASVNANFDCFKDGMELNITNSYITGGKGYLYGIQNGQDTGSAKFVKATVTDNYFDRRSHTGNVISHYQDAAWQKDEKSNAYTDDSVIKDNVFIADTNQDYGTYEATISIQENFFGTRKSEGSEVIPTHITGLSKLGKDKKVYYVDPAMTTTTTEMGLVDNGYDAFKHNDFGSNWNNYEITKTTGATAEMFKAVDGATVVGVYSDENCTQEITGAITHPQTVYVKTTKNGLTLPNKVVLTTTCDHVGGEQDTNVVDPDCGTPGSKDVVCKYCSISLDTSVTIPATGNHTASDTVTPKPGQEGNCGVAGLGHKLCTVCGQIAEDNVTIPATGNHTASDTVTTKTGKEPTCGTDGLGHKLCTVCGQIAEDNITVPATGNHAWDAGVVQLNPECHTSGKKGEMLHTCTNADCGTTKATKVEPIDTVDCVGNGVWVTTVDAYCTVDGVETQYCKWCGGVYDTRTKAQTGHTWDAGVKQTDPECHNSGVKGTTLYTCTNTLCLQDGSKATDLRSDIATVACVGDGTWYNTKTVYCLVDGEDSMNCKWCARVCDTRVATAPGAHAYDDGVEDPVHNCMKDGVMTYTCTRDNCLVNGTKQTYTRIVESTGEHNFVGEEKIPATCTSEGVITYTCYGCNTSHDEAIPLKGHHYVAVTTKDPTCVEDGVMTYTCDNVNNNVACGATYTEPIPANGSHDFKAEVTLRPTCDAVGTMTYTCQRILAGGDPCGAVVTEDIPAIGHNYDTEFTVDIKPTGSVEGEKSKHCLNPGCDSRIEITNMGYCQHVNVDPLWVVDLDATCQNTGLKHQVCLDCGDSINSTVIALLPHDYVGEITKYANCTEDGEMTYTCQRLIAGVACGHVKTEVIPNLGGHKFTGWSMRNESTCTEPGTDYRTCIVCSEIEYRDRDLIAHDFEEEFTVDIHPTGTVIGQKSRHCKNCDAKTDITNLGYCPHTNVGPWIVDKEASCGTGDGEKHQVCVDCGDDCNITVIPAPAHNFVEVNINKQPTCTEPGQRALACSECNEPKTETIPANGHSTGVWHTTKAPTCTVNGEEIRECLYCDYVFEKRAIEKLGHGEGVWVTVTPAGCETDGLSSYFCTVCNTKIGSFDQAIPATGHKAVHINTIPATCTEPGLRDYECAVCGKTDLDVVIPETGHTAGAWEVITPATTHSYGVKVKYCTVCDEEIERDFIEQIVCEGNPFKDVAKNAWYRKAVNFVYCSGLMNGTSDTTFSPNLSTTRGMFVTILGRLSGINPKDYTRAYFEDVKDGSYYFGYIEWARANGIVNGTGNYVFEPDRAITRQEMCKMILSYAEYRNIDLEYVNSKVTFKDEAKIASWAKSAVAKCQRAGIVNGDAAGTFRPTDTASRAEVATIIMNFCDNCLEK